MSKMQEPHRKRVKHFEESADVHELTFSCVQRRPLLTNDVWRAWFCSGLDRACKQCKFHLLAYVLMPEHVHLLVWPAPEHRASLPPIETPERRKSRFARFLKHVKQPFSRRIKAHLAESASPLLRGLTIRQRPDEMTFRFWQEGPGYDRNLKESGEILTAIEYIHGNPVRRGLCVRAVDWRWSSAPRLLMDGPLDEAPRLARFDPTTGRVDSRL
jgi:putative transposase